MKHLWLPVLLHSSHIIYLQEKINDPKYQVIIYNNIISLAEGYICCGTCRKTCLEFVSLKFFRASRLLRRACLVLVLLSSLKSGFQSPAKSSFSGLDCSSNVTSCVASQPAVCRSVWTEESVWEPTPVTAPPGGKACCARSVSFPTKHTRAHLHKLTHRMHFIYFWLSTPCPRKTCLTGW